MTIAVCYLTPEGVVFGADSTASYLARDGIHYLNHAQKVFELGENSSLGLVGWGLGEIDGTSIRTLVAECSDTLVVAAPKSVEKVAERWGEIVWSRYKKLIAAHASKISRFLDLAVQDRLAKITSEDELTEYKNLTRDLSELRTGFFVGGRAGGNRQSEAFSVQFDVLAAQPKFEPLPMGDINLEGEPNYAHRLVRGIDPNIREAILKSKFWKGDQEDLDEILRGFALMSPVPPIRDAIDHVHALVHATIKALKFSPNSQIVGGPIEVAVITADRDWRWVRHKTFESAINDGQP
jgi:hypothetical protein